MKPLFLMLIVCFVSCTHYQKILSGKMISTKIHHLKSDEKMVTVKEVQESKCGGETYEVFENLVKEVEQRESSMYLSDFSFYLNAGPWENCYILKGNAGIVKKMELVEKNNEVTN